MKLTFLGATGTVTGSKYLVECGKARILVDCGLFQGLKALRKRNWAGLPFDPRSLDALILTHAHLDHSGYLPVLVERGFRGKVHCTSGTRSLCSVLLPDSGHLQEEAAKYANRKGFSKHAPALPLYTEEQAHASLRQFKTHAFGKRFSPARGIECQFSRAGHILGSACVQLSDGETKLTFSGDVGRPTNPVLLPPETLAPTDYLVLESTYGDRLHPHDTPELQLAEVARRTFERGGVLLIPSFAVGRSQMILHLLAELRASGEIPSVPLFMDSPMAIKATGIYCGRDSEFRLDEEQSRAMCKAATFLQSPEESISLNAMKGPLVILSASGMATGGRVLHHLKRLLPDPRNSILFVGFQASGTRGAQLVGGAQTVKIHGAQVQVRAEVHQLDSLSAHGDRDELVEWLRRVPGPGPRTFVTHGEPGASAAMKVAIERELGWQAEVPADGQSVLLGTKQPT